MARKMLPDPPTLKKLLISTQDNLLEIHQQIRTLLNTLTMRTNLREYSTVELHAYLCVISNLSDQALSLLEQIISISRRIEEEEVEDADE